MWCVCAANVCRTLQRTKMVQISVLSWADDGELHRTEWIAIPFERFAARARKNGAQIDWVKVVEPSNSTNRMMIWNDGREISHRRCEIEHNFTMTNELELKWTNGTGNGHAFECIWHVENNRIAGEQNLWRNYGIIRRREFYMFPKYFGCFSIGLYSSSEMRLNLIKCLLFGNRRGGRMRTKWPGRRECIFLLFCKPKIALRGLSLLDTMVIEWSTSDFFRSLFSVISHQINGLRVCIYYFVTHGRNKSFGCATNVQHIRNLE